MNNMEAFFRSVLEQDRAPVVLCDLNHTIIYMNPAAAAHYASSGGMELLGQSLRHCHSPMANKQIDRVLTWFSADKEHHQVYTYCNTEENKDVYMIALRAPDGELIGYYEKHEYRNRETKKQYDME